MCTGGRGRKGSPETMLILSKGVGGASVFRLPAAPCLLAQMSKKNRPLRGEALSGLVGEVLRGGG